jgi:hypothetical protein
MMTGSATSKQLFPDCTSRMLHPNLFGLSSHIYFQVSHGKQVGQKEDSRYECWSLSEEYSRSECGHQWASVVGEHRQQQAEPSYGGLCKEGQCL